MKRHVQASSWASGSDLAEDWRKTTRRATTLGRGIEGHRGINQHDETPGTILGKALAKESRRLEDVDMRAPLPMPRPSR